MGGLSAAGPQPAASGPAASGPAASERAADRTVSPARSEAPAATETLIAWSRAYLSRVAEPAQVPVWRFVRDVGPVVAARRIRAGDVVADVRAATEARAETTDPDADLDAAARHGIRLVTPESTDWPHFAFAALEHAALERVRRWDAGDRARRPGGELLPPLALWLIGPAELSELAVRSVGIVGARAATAYGERVAADFACGLARRGFAVVSGGAFGIDAAAHRGALAVGGTTVLVSAGGVDRPYPVGNARIFAAAAKDGIVISESPPGCAPHRGRFLTRNRLVAALSTGIVVAEASHRSGSLNTAAHARGLGRPVMAVPGPVTSPLSQGCHRLLQNDLEPALLVTSVDDVLAVIGTAVDARADGEPTNADVPDAAGLGSGRKGGPDPERQDRSPTSDSSPTRADHPAGPDVRVRLDALDAVSRQVYDGLPARAAVDITDLAVRCGIGPLAVARALPGLELAGLVQTAGHQVRRHQPQVVRATPR